jgi:HEAT repeat protein
MRTTDIRIVFALIAIFSMNAISADDTPYEKQSSSELISQVARHNSYAIMELGRRRERSAAPVLRSIASEHDVDYLPHPKKQSQIAEWRMDSLVKYHINVSHREARISLARLGEKQYLDEFIVGLSSSNLDWRANCIEILGRIGDKRAVPYLIPILDDNRMQHAGQSISYANAAVGSLIDILPDVEKKLAQQHVLKADISPNDWKEWWSKNHSSYGGEGLKK